MKKKEILLIIGSLATIGVSAYFLIGLLFPNPLPEEGATEESGKVPVINTEFDENTFRIVEDLSDHGIPELEGIGKDDIFRSN